MIYEVNNKEVLILGCGKSGKYAALLAKQKGANVTLLDTGRPDVTGLEEISIRLGENALSWNGKCDLVIFSPGVPIDSPLGKLGLATGAQTVSELAFGASFIQCPIIAVTGTNGKTTTVEMLEHCIKAAGHKAVAAGNIGLPLSQIVLEKRELDFLIAEVSSFQLEHPGNFTPTTAAILNITPDHIIRHHSMEIYSQTKFNIFKNMLPSQIKIANSSIYQINNKEHSLNSMHFFCFSAKNDDNAKYFMHGNWLSRREDNGDISQLVNISELPFSGTHNYENALAAIALCDAVGLNPIKIAKHLCSFQTDDHRMQTVAKFGGLTFIDDSKATNVDALIKALATIAEREKINAQKSKIALIAGGLDKDCTLDEAIPYLKQHVIFVALIGKCSQRLMSTWGKAIPARTAVSMQDAVNQAANALRGEGIVLLSPACASQDMFSDYAQRGNCFAACAQNYGRQ